MTRPNPDARRSPRRWFSPARLRRAAGTGCVAALVALPGCAGVGGGSRAEPDLTYLGDARPAEHIERGPRISYPAGVENDVRPLLGAGAPRTVADRARAEIWDLPLDAAVKLALEHSEILRTVAPRGNVTGTGFQTAALTNPDFAPSLFDPAISQTGVLFGNRGVEAALADFDANFTSSLLFDRSETLGNNPNFAGAGAPIGAAIGPGGGTGARTGVAAGGGAGGIGLGVGALTPGETITNTATYQSQLSKTLATGGNVAAFGNVNYLDSDPAFGLFPNNYTTNVGLRFTQPLLAGSGVEYTRIAGPRNPNFSAITGVNQGVTIARINEDVALLDFERNVRDLVKSVEDSYWNLYAAYRQYDIRLTARNSALRTWRDLSNRLEVENLGSDELAAAGGDGVRQVAFQQPGGVGGETTAVQLAQAESQYFSQKSLATQALNQIYAAEAELRRVMVLPVNDGRVIRPATEPVTAEFSPDWRASLTEALCHRPELRQQKFRVKSLELQLTAARSLLQPSLNFVSQAQVNGFGDDLIADEGDSGAFGTLADGDQTGWQLGLEFSAPIGFRQARLQVRNLEYRLTKARKVLAAQELDVSHQLADAFQQVALRHSTATSFFNQIGAARERVRLFEEQRQEGVVTTDLLLRAQTDLAAAEGSYFQEIVAYNQAQSLLQLSKGTLLPSHGVHLAEGMWTPQAYQQALRRAWERSHALPADFMEADPAPLAVPEDERACPVHLTNGLPPGANFVPRQVPTDYTPGPLPPPVPVPEPTPEEDAADRNGATRDGEPLSAPAPLPMNDAGAGDAAESDAEPNPEEERSPGDRKVPPSPPGDLDVEDILRGLDLNLPDDLLDPDAPLDDVDREARAPGEPLSAAEAVRRVRRERALGGWAPRAASTRVTPAAGVAPFVPPTPPVRPARTFTPPAPPAPAAPAPTAESGERKWRKIGKSRGLSIPVPRTPRFLAPNRVTPPAPAATEETPIPLGTWVTGEG